MRAELGLERKELPESLVEGLLPSSMLPPKYHGNPIDFEITGGQVHDAKVADKVLGKISTAEHLIADKGYDSEEGPRASQVARNELRSFRANPTAKSRIQNLMPISTSCEIS
jgi:hypothetical protein